MDKHRWIRFGSGICIIALLLSACAAGQEPQTKRGTESTKAQQTTQPAKTHAGLPEEPILRVETGMHTARIKRIGVDAAETTLATCSYDKTVRIWDLTTGELRKVLRVPINQKKDGMLYAVALSLDGRTVAAGGWTGTNAKHDVNLYILDVSTGHIRHRIGGLPRVINHLTFSKDGRYLAATFHGDNGIRIYDTNSWVQVASHGVNKTNQGHSYWADFAPDGRLVFTSFDGYVRLLDSNFKLIAKRKPSGGKRPRSAVFSPDRSRIAVGIINSSEITVLSGQDLAFLYSPKTPTLKNGDLATVAWSKDGQTLFAGGRWDVDGLVPIRAWSRAGQGPFRDFTVSQNTIMQIIGLKSGNLLYGTQDPSWGVLNHDGKKILTRTASIANPRENQEGFKVSRNGQVVRFAYEYGGQRPALFNVASRTLTPPTTTQDQRELTAPKTSAPGLSVTNWKHNYEPQLNGNRLELKQYEFCHSLAIALDEKAFILGTGWYVRCFDHKARQKWQQPVSGPARTVNVSGDGRLAVVALGDGTINWYRMDSGEKLLTLFPHADGKRWVLWTPSGYYAASAGAEDIIGWHLNRGRDQAPDFFPASRFRNAYYRPSVTSTILETLDEDLALAKAPVPVKQKPAAPIQDVLPPVVTIVSPDDNTIVAEKNVTIAFHIRHATDTPLTRFKVLVNGRPITVDANELNAILTPDANPEYSGTKGIRLSRRITVPLSAEETSIALIAENRHAASVPADIRIQRPAAPKITTEKAPTPQVLKPKLYVLAIGVSAYQQGKLTLSYAAQDATDVAKVFQAQTGKLYRQVEVNLMPDATREQVLSGLEWIERETTARDVAVLFLAGHGVNDRNGNYYFLPADVDPDGLKRTGIPYHEIKNTVTGLPGKIVAFLDTCHAGNVLGTRRELAQVDMDRIANELSAAENGVVVFASSTGRQYSVENKEWQNGAFSVLAAVISPP